MSSDRDAARPLAAGSGPVPHLAGGEGSGGGEGLLCHIGEVAARWDPCGHRFVERWVAGELPLAELRLYASESYHALLGLAQAWYQVAGEADGVLAVGLARHASAARQELDDWLAFAKATGWRGWSAAYFGEDPLPATEECALVWSGAFNRGIAERLACLFVVEACRPPVCLALLKGLFAAYGMAGEKETRWFYAHAWESESRIGCLREALLDSASQAEMESMVAQVEAACRAGWRLLDGVDEQHRQRGANVI